MIGVGSAGPRGPGSDDDQTPPDPSAGRQLALARAPASTSSDLDAPGPLLPQGGLLSEGGTLSQNARPQAAVPPDERAAWAVLAGVDGLGPVSFGRLLRRFGSAQAVLEAARLNDAIPQLMLGRNEDGPPLGADLAERLVLASRRAEDFLADLERAMVSPITLEEDGYPARLRAIELPPPVLFVRGDTGALVMERVIAVVGTRRPTEHGRRLASAIGLLLARHGVCVVSGLALGIDGAAHAAVVERGGQTVAVLGGGHAQLSPRAHRSLAARILATGGAIISEFPPPATPTRGAFPRRNRIISGLAEATIVVEAGVRSGALITAGWALEQGRECFLVPGPIGAAQSRGCIEFLRAFGGQARIVAGLAALVEDLRLISDTSEQANPHRGEPPGTVRRARRDPSSSARRPDPKATLTLLAGAELAVARQLFGRPKTADELVSGTGLAIATVLGTLTMLEVRGLVRGAYGRYQLTGELAALSVGGR